MLAIDQMGNTVQFVFYAIGLVAFVAGAVSFKLGDGKANLLGVGLAAIIVPSFWDRLVALDPQLLRRRPVPSGAGRRPRQNSLRSPGAPARRSLEVDLDALDAAALGVDPRLRLDPRRHEHAARRRERAVAVEAFLVAQQLLDAGDLADALHLDHDGAAVAVAAQQVDRPEIGRVLAPDELEVVAQRVRPAPRSAPGARPRRRPSRARGRRRGRSARRTAPRAARCTSRSPFGLRHRDHVAVLDDRARRAHPVQRLVRLGVGVDRHRAVGLEERAGARAGGSRAPSRPAYSTEQCATTRRTAALYHAAVAVRVRPRRRRALRCGGPRPREGRVLIGAYSDDCYKIVLVLHILCAIVGLRRRVPQRRLRPAGEGTPRTGGPRDLPRPT